MWAGRLLGRPLPERVAGIDLMHGMLARGRHRGYRVFCLGATDEVLRTDGRADQTDYPVSRSLVIRTATSTVPTNPSRGGTIAASKSRHPVRGNDLTEEGELPRRVGAAISGPDMPRRRRIVRRPGRQGPRAPEFWQRLGLEWLYRVKQEPGRLWRRYLTTNLLFILLVGRELLRQTRRSRYGARRTPPPRTRAADEQARTPSSSTWSPARGRIS